MQASISGEITFQQESNLNKSIVANIAPQWLIDYPGNTLYARVASDGPTLELVRDIIMEGRQETSNFQPTLAFIATWHNNETNEVIHKAANSLFML